MKSWNVHYRNKHPGGCKVVADDHSFDVYRGDEHLVAVRKGGDGVWHDCQHEFGASYPHSLDPLPVDARAWKLDEQGHIVKHEKHDERRVKGEEYAKKYGFVPGAGELAKLEGKK